MNGEHNRNGGLTLVPMPGHENAARMAREVIESKRQTTVDIATPDIGRRANGEPYVRLAKDHTGGHDCMILTSGPGTDSLIVDLLFLLGALAGRGPSRITLIVNYFPLSRSDKDEGISEFALAPHMVALIKAAAHGYLKKIIAVDLHSPQVVMAGHPGLITPVSLARRVLKLVLHDARQVTDKICIFLPDDGAAKQYENGVAEEMEEAGLKLPIFQGIKRRRNSYHSELLQFHGDPKQLQGALVICLDDEGATLGTQRGTAEKLKHGCGISQFWAAMIHGVMCGDAIEYMSASNILIDRLYITDTIPVHTRPALEAIPKERLQIINWTEDLASIIHFHHWDSSIRQMR